MPTRLILTLFFSSLLLLSLSSLTTAVSDSDDLDEDLSFLDADDDTDTHISSHQPHDHDHADESNEEDDEDFGNFDDFDESQFGDDSDPSEYSVPEVDDKDVVVLKERNFTDVIEGNKFVMVEFYAPWCGHCQSLAPEYAAAATQLKEEGVKDVVLAKVDATEENELAHQFDVQGFPTVYFFVDGEHKLYNGQRTKEAIVTWIKKKTGPSVHNITTTEEAEKILTSNEKVVLAYLDSLTGPESDELAAASRNEDDLSFYQTVKPNVAKLFEIDADAKRPALVLLKKDVEKFNHFDGKFEKSAISEFVFANKLPLVTTFTRESASVIFESQIKKQMLLFATSNDSETVLPVFREAAKSFKGKLIFVYVQLDNEDTGKPVAEFFGVSGDEPKVIGYSGNDDGKKFFLDGEVTLDKLKAFAQGFVDDTLKPFYKSEPVPETNDGDVKIVVGNNFDEIVLDESKDVLLEIYAPWCGHCQSLEPIYNKLARHLREWMWQYPSVSGASLTPVNNFVNRQSICELEGDATVEDILNQQLKMYTSLSQTRSDVRMVQSLVPIWEEEFERIGVHDAEILADPGRPPPQDVLKTLSNGVEYMDNLKGLYSKLESNLLDRSEDVKSMVPTQCPIEEESIMGTRNQNSNELVLRSSEDVNIEHCVTPHQSVSVDAIGALLGKSVEMDEMDILQGTDSEDVALLKWLASSQAAVDMNSDDELHQETILNPMLPAATIDKVLKIANTDYENGSQQECQDILDSIVDVLNSDDQKGKRTSIGQDLSGSKIPKFDGAGDDHQFTPAANLPEQIDTESVSSKHHTFPHCSSSFDDKQKKPKLQFGHQLTPAANLPEKMDTESVSSKRHTFPHSSSSFDDKQKKSKLQFGPLPLSEVQQFTTNIHSDPSTKNADGSGCYVVDSRTQHSGSVRDLMRKKQSFRVGSSSSGKSVEEGFVKENNVFYPRKLEFHTEPSEEQNLMAAEFSPSSHMQIDKQTEVCEVRQSATDCPVGKEKQDIANSSVADAEVVKVDSVKQHASVSPPFAFGHMDETESVGYISMTFHKKPPLASWKNGTSQNSASIPVPSRWCSVKDDSDDEGTSVQGGVPEDVHPFFTDSSKSVSQESHGFGIGVPTHYYNDGSYAYLLTPAVSPPSVDSVFNWLALEEKERTRAKPLPDDSSELTLLEPMNNRLDGENHRNLDMEGVLMKDELAPCLDKGSSLKEKNLTKLSQDISQISGPSGQSKSTPLSQIGFRDPASVGAGQQLTLLSIEVQAESRGDLRPDPQHDSINIIVIAVQNDSSPSVDIYALLRGSTEGCGRNLDGISECRMLVYPEERDLLDKFISITCSIDPDILIGWDVQGNSLGFLAERASHLGLSLINKISRTPAERKAVNRDLDTSDKETAAAVSSDSLMSDTVLDDNTIIEDEWGRTHASGVHVTGRIVLNVWRLVRSEVKLNMYSLEAVAEAVLRRKVPSIHWNILNKWFSSGPGKARFRCIEYFVERVKLNFDIVNQLDMINRTSELARVFGIDFFSVLSRGSQYRVESMLVRLAHTQNYVLISPGYQQVASQPAMECIPLVMEPESGFYSDPVVVLDFQSLYPSMIIAYNLCFSTCLGNVVPSKADCLGVSSYSPDLQILKDLNQQILVTPNGVMYVPSEVRKGILPRLLEEILSTRVMVKQAMKSLAPSQQVLQRIFNARQLALKLIANVTYGYTAAGFSGRMPCAELADSIVQCGRKTLEHAILFVNKHDQWNARVLYGDTDSMFVLLKGRTLKEAFRIGNEIASTITAMNPNPVKLKMEKVYQSCFLLTKKRYVGYSYESLSQPAPMFDAKGIETVRRDTCPAVAKTLEKSLRMFFECQDISKLKAYLQRQWSRILSGRISIQDFVFAKEVRLGTYSTRASSSLPPAAIVASKAMRVDPRAEPRYAERILYVVVHGEPGARLVDMVVDPQELLSMESPYRLNDLYYITKQIIPALQRVFGLIGADLRQWFQDMPRPVRDAPAKQHFSAVNSLRARIDYYYSSKHCVLCGELVQTANYFCEKCSKKGPVTVAAMTGRTLKLERDIQHLVAICRHCGGGDWLVESGVKCTSLACSVYYERRKVQKELRAFSGIATEAGFYPKCMVEWF